MKGLLDSNPATGRHVFSRTERLLADYLGNERQALRLAPHIYLPEGLSDEEITARIESFVIRGLVDVLTDIHEATGIAGYVGGERRDTVR